MKTLLVTAAMVSVAVMSMTGCADVDPTIETQSESVVMIGDNGEEITITITFDSTVMIDHVEDLLTNIAVVEGEGVSVVETGLQNRIPVPAADPHWTLDDHSITVDVNVEGLQQGDLVLSRSWEWIDASDLEDFCPPGH